MDASTVACATVCARAAAWVARQPRERVLATVVVLLVAVLIPADRRFVTITLSNGTRAGDGTATSTHAHRVARCVSLEARPENADACGAVERSPRGVALYCLFEGGARASAAAPRAVTIVFDPEEVLLEGQVRPMFEMDAPCADVKQARERHTRAVATSRQCPPVSLEGASAACLQHLRETVLTGWTCPAVPRASTNTAV